MAGTVAPNIVTDGLVLYLDAANIKSYPGSGTVWRDIIGPNNGTLVNGPTFDSGNGGSIVFDGIDDFSRPTTNHSYLSSSALEVIFNSSNHGTGNKTIFGYRHNAGYSQPTIGSIYLNNNTLLASVITTSQVYRTATFPIPLQTNTTYHVILNKDTINGTLQLFVNSIGGNIQTFDPTTYAQWPPSNPILIGANILDIGKSTNTAANQGWDSDYFNGKFFKISIYNRTLTPQEILQNYNATKTRFGL
jgi:hypothetical protein